MSSRVAVASAVGLVLVGLLAISDAGAASARPVTFRADDGIVLAATLVEATRSPAPAVILLHMQSRSREDWLPVGQRLAEAGVHALAVDFRSHGGSGAAPPGPDGGTDWTRLVLDVKAARSYLAGRSDLVQSGAIGIAGASIGANAAVLYAAGDPAIRSLALLSPGRDYRSLRIDTALRKYAARPALLVAATNDPYAVRSVKELTAEPGQGIREVRTLPNAGHGTAMLDRDPELSRALVDWFLRTLL
jgi:pimeloyl-ACP methyl ester carboxylesterase